MVSGEINVKYEINLQVKSFKTTYSSLQQ